MALLTTSNSKLGNYLPSFSLPAISTCPGKTRACRNYCYGIMGRYIFRSIKKRLKRMYRFSKRADFADMIISEINSYILEGFYPLKVRIHPTGDFYSQEYFDKWVKIANTFPRITFVAYTRSHMFRMEHRPRNFILFYSVDEDTKIIPTWAGNKTAIVKKVDAILQGDLKSHFVCNAKCHSCNKCYTRNNGKGVIFMERGWTGTLVKSKT